ncbi:GTP-binding protein YsxC [Spiroplasma sabaudiense Ar-1343]|uniref:Probable GTP-binding protein EngB n=1 Tax=Spiroplasma sabaudiense Ar-1343 TaxID=1276257 RepID=W6A9N8_9MOLU|nr:ribosome biogenesis GTP-binding protein YihA/YsxC [Spiroplasma sabaudiense]AHI53878.1 GTP-binding protein YsxC [Spiroplasma sabaudiense Ar-1343]
MEIKQAVFIKSAAKKEGWISDDISEVCFVGRSNVGKSSFINALTNNNKLAKISSTPGKTRLLNFFSINNDQFRIVDAPGYGFAKVNINLKIQFAEMMEEYLTQRTNLKFICQLVDLRHSPSKDDIEMYQFFKHYNIKVFMVGTKLDKLKRNDIAKNEKIIKSDLQFDSADHFVKFSNKDRKNIREITNIMAELLGLEDIQK